MLGAVLYLSKRGRPPGALLHSLHGLELTRLPGLLRPTPQRYSAKCSVALVLARLLRLARPQTPGLRSAPGTPRARR